MTLPLIEKYRAKTFAEIKGQDSAISDLKTFFKTFPRKKAIILNGPVGTGKTSITIALANEYNLELFELNASDLRNRKKLEEILKPASQQSSLFKKGKIILMDEADGITTSDNGGLPELIALIEKTAYPIIITANDIWQRKFSLLRQKCQIINLKELKESTILEIVTDILKKEKRELSKETISLIVKNSKGDVRSALNDLQIALSLGENIFIEELSEREKQESIFETLKKLFQERTTKDSVNLFDNTNMGLDEIVLWIEENIPSEYKGLALVKAYEYLSKADVFKGRIYRQQYWRFLVYQNFFLSFGISSASKLKSSRYTQYKPPSRILKIWLSNQKNAKKKSISQKYAENCHMSKKKAMKDSFLHPFIICKEAEDKLKLDEKEREYLKDKRGAIIVANKLNRFRI
ncbi:MAG: replication factor C large subunit [Nanoarchaeota archaeon]|nr:replication factor C large subunit [Nanoarchaeota archaeon]